jgi:hypothetical protein
MALLMEELTGLGNKTNLTVIFVHINANMFHGWSPFCAALSAFWGLTQSPITLFAFVRKPYRQSAMGLPVNAPRLIPAVRTESAKSPRNSSKNAGKSKSARQTEWQEPGSNAL